ncbi:MAG: DUF1549 domain-containing protein, partial [Planctomycetaceae bacterium]|nr:DUF1549 domain-containing protein [Planctomycetaceae bacterium]
MSQKLRFSRRRLFSAALLFLSPYFLTTSVAADDAANREFAEHVYPILQRFCMECHGPTKQEGSLRLDSRAALEQSGTVVPGSPDDSELLRRVLLPDADDERMPAAGQRLPAEQIRHLQQWILDGAVWPEHFETGKHWAYQPPRRPVVPEASGVWSAQNAIDRFVQHRLLSEQLSPSPQAEPTVLIRRLCLDLTGLPPAPDEVERFVRDPSDANYQTIVDELLARPQFGERWARPWLDLARYADSHGFQRDDLRDVWPYRDWVIRAINDDMPFDQFTIEQIAGDLLPDATESQRIATGFHRCTPTNVEAGSLPEETRIEQVIDRVNTTGAVWMGTTLECAQCHDHKYDPFTMHDYYRLLAFFNSTQREADRTDPDKPSSIAFMGPALSLKHPERDQHRADLQEQIRALQKQVAARRQELAATLPDYARQLTVEAGTVSETHVLSVERFESRGTTDTHRVLDDGSILLIGDDPPSEDLYAVTGTAAARDVRAIRLDALTHESLSGSGPGRGDSVRSNFVLNEFTASVKRADGEIRPLTFKGATADFSQAKWDVSGAIDGDPKSGWAIAPQFSKPHHAVFLLSTPLTVTSEDLLTVSLDQHFGNARSLGRFRLSVVTGNPNADPLPAELLAAAAKKADEWNDKERKLLLEHCVENDPRTQSLNAEVTRFQEDVRKLAPDESLVMIELEEKRPTSVFMRGDYRQPGERVFPATPASLPGLSEIGPSVGEPGERQLTRLDLGRWLASRSNPLVARVTVNRWWAEIFGRGIVATVEDFGIKGDRPTHPELLD